MVVREAAEVVALGLDRHELGCEACGSEKGCAAGDSLLVALAELVRIASSGAEAWTAISAAA